MCIGEYTAFVCGHSTNIVIRRCPLSQQHKATPQCSIIPDRPFFVDCMCQPCSRVVWNQTVLQNEREHRKMHEVGSCACLEVHTQQEIRGALMKFNWKARKYRRSQGGAMMDRSLSSSQGSISSSLLPSPVDAYGQMAYYPAPVLCHQVQEIDAPPFARVLNYPGAEWYPSQYHVGQYQPYSPFSDQSTLVEQAYPTACNEASGSEELPLLFSGLTTTEDRTRHQHELGIAPVGGIIPAASGNVVRMGNVVQDGKAQLARDRSDSPPVAFGHRGSLRR
jgi:hypothetical protein